MDEDEFYDTDRADDRVTLGQLKKHCKEQFETGCTNCIYQKFCEDTFYIDPKDFKLR